MMKTSPDLSTLPTDDLIKRLQKKDQIITLLALLAICGSIIGLSVGVAVGFPTGLAFYQRAK